MLDRGREFVCLYTNAASTTANHVYEGIGYTFVADSMQYRFTNAG
jgi:predicted GNAT family acetyltransferase